MIMTKKITTSSIVIFHKDTWLYNAQGTSGDRVVILRDGYEPREPLEAWNDEVLNLEDGLTFLLQDTCPNFFCDKHDEPGEHDIVGAHVLLSPAEHDIRTGEEVFLIPLCRSCNSSGPDKDIYLTRDTPALRLIWNVTDVERTHADRIIRRNTGRSTLV